MRDSTRKPIYETGSSEVRYQVKPLIDAAAFRLAQGTTGVALLLAQQVGHLPPHTFSLLALPLIGMWLLALRRLRNIQPGWVQ